MSQLKVIDVTKQVIADIIPDHKIEFLVDLIY